MSWTRHLWRRRTLVRPTAAGWLLLLAAAVGAARLAAPRAYDFLARVPPPGGDGVLVVEGWIADDAIGVAAAAARRGRYARTYATGAPLDVGDALLPHGSLAEVTALRLVAAGVPRESVVAVPAPRSRRDRTYAAALALRARLEADGVRGGRVDLVTLEPHARRSRLLYRRALGPAFEVGAWTCPHPRFGRSDWWRSSEGFKSVVVEWIGWWYTLAWDP